VFRAITTTYRILGWFLVATCVLLMVLGALAAPGRSSAADGVSEGPSQHSANYLPGDDVRLERASLMAKKRAEDSSDWLSRGVSIFGIFGLVGIAWLFSTDRKAIKWRIVVVGTGLQLTFAIFILWTPLGRALFEGLNDAVMKLLEFTRAGSDFLFRSFVTGSVEPSLVNFTFGILPTIIFFSSLMTVLYHLGVMQILVRWMSAVMVRLMGTSGSETLSASANIFVGQTEAPLVVKPYVATMTRSELMAVMTGGFATVAGGVLAAYVAMLSPSFPDIAGHLIAASVMSAPAALVISKVMMPETEESVTMGVVKLPDERPDANAIDAAARGASEGMKLALNVGAMLLAFIALVALLNAVIGLPSNLHNSDALQNINNVLVSGAGSAPEGCSDPADSKATVRCAYEALVTIANQRGIVIPEDLRTLEGEEDQQLTTVEALGAEVAAQLEVAHPLVGSSALEDCRGGRVAACGAVLTLTQSDTWTTKLEAPDFWPFITLELLLGWLFFPMAWLMGVPWEDCHAVGQLLGEKMVLNELIAYLHLTEIIDTLRFRSIVICTYALCGFANFSSIAIQIGGIGSIAPSRRHDLSRLGMRAMIAGTIAAFMTATIAGALVY